MKLINLLTLTLLSVGSVVSMHAMQRETPQERGTTISEMCINNAREKHERGEINANQLQEEEALCLREM